VLGSCACPGWRIPATEAGPLRSSGAMLPDARAGRPTGLQIEERGLPAISGWLAGWRNHTGNGAEIAPRLPNFSGV